MIRKNGQAQAADQAPEILPIDEISDLVDTPAARSSQEVYSEQTRRPLAHFHLSMDPFMDSVNPEFFFRTEAHEEAFVRMKQCIDDDVALGMTTAVSGTGKTMLTQILLQELDPRRFKTILILVYPSMTRTALLREIISELEITPPSGSRPSVHQMISTIQAEIIRLRRRGLKLVIIIDEVHFLRADTLHILRTLSNIETPEKKLVTILLFGEEGFNDKLNEPRHRSLRSRIFERVSLRPLNREELEQYIKFRCLMAGGGPSLFEPQTFGPIHEQSGGIPREINRICHAALSCAARKGMIRVDRTALD